MFLGCGDRRTGDAPASDTIGTAGSELRRTPPPAALTPRRPRLRVLRPCGAIRRATPAASAAAAPAARKPAAPKPAPRKLRARRPPPRPIPRRRLHPQPAPPAAEPSDTPLWRCPGERTPPGRVPSGPARYGVAAGVRWVEAVQPELRPVPWRGRDGDNHRASPDRRRSSPMVRSTPRNCSCRPSAPAGPRKACRRGVRWAWKWTRSRRSTPM